MLANIISLATPVFRQMTGISQQPTGYSCFFQAEESKRLVDGRLAGLRKPAKKQPGMRGSGNNDLEGKKKAVISEAVYK
jgi:hypothetical protein